MFDCDGVIWLGQRAIEGSFEALDYLISKGKKVFLLTNASYRSREELFETKLKQTHGFDKIPFDQIYTAAYMTAEYLKQVVSESPVENPSIYVVGMSGFKKELENAGLRVINMDETSENDTMGEAELASF